MRFQKGDKVKHKIGERLMIVAGYEEEVKVIQSAFGKRYEKTGRFTTKVKCEWFENGNLMRELFEEAVLELAEN